MSIKVVYLTNNQIKEINPFIFLGQHFSSQKLKDKYFNMMLY